MDAQAINTFSNRWRQASMRSGVEKRPEPVKAPTPAPARPAVQEQAQEAPDAAKATAPAPAPAPAPAVQAVPPIVVVSSRYVLIPVAAAMTGLSVKAIERKIERGVWIEGKHFRRRDGGNYIDMEAYKRWVEEGK